MGHLTPSQAHESATLSDDFLVVNAHRSTVSSLVTATASSTHRRTQIPEAILFSKIWVERGSLYKGVNRKNGKTIGTDVPISR
jgi:hypothetical protein